MRSIFRDYDCQINESELLIKLPNNSEIAIKGAEQENNLRTHNYLTRIDDQQWEDLQKIKQLDNRSVNSYINEGIRLVVKEKLQQISTMKKNRNTLEDMVSI